MQQIHDLLPGKTLLIVPMSLNPLRDQVLWHHADTPGIVRRVAQRHPDGKPVLSARIILVRRPSGCSPVRGHIVGPEEASLSVSGTEYGCQQARQRRDPWDKPELIVDKGEDQRPI